MDLAPAAASDDLADTLHYGELAERVAAIVGGEPCDLIEAVAGRIADDVLTDPRVSAGEGVLPKPQALIPLGVVDVAGGVDPAPPGPGGAGPPPRVGPGR